jgi:hypothetical protein
MFNWNSIQDLSLNGNIIRKSFSKTVFNLFIQLLIGEKMVRNREKNGFPYKREVVNPTFEEVDAQK